MISIATDADFLGFYRTEPPPLWIGLVERCGDRITAFGTVIWSENGDALGFVDRRGPVSAFTLHRGARRMMNILKDVGEPALYVACDETVPGAAEWLRRLGFARIEDMPADAPDTWMVRLVAERRRRTR